MILSPTFNSIAAAFVYGGWAAYANSEHATDVWLRAGLVQAATSFTVTLVITLFARWVFLRSGGGRRGVAIGYVCSFCSVTLFSYGAHYISGTPDIWQTITPSMIIGSAYLVSYLLALKANLKREV
ncbi:MAG: hypothetical protein P8P30_05325 [Rickettsiales bacterium]|nr:hypothetical protein [Rickettsiales bacterium]